MLDAPVSLRLRTPVLLLAVLALLSGAAAPAAAAYPPLRTVTTGSTPLGNNFFSLHYEVFDPLRNQTRRHTTSAVHPLTIAAVDGVVHWTEQTYDAFGQNVFVKVHFAVYDPQFGMWKHGQSNWDGINSVINANGVVAWSSVVNVVGGGQLLRIHYATYDPQHGDWIFGESNADNIRNLINRDGVVEWTTITESGFSTFAQVHGTIYDPSRGEWRSMSSSPFSFATNLMVNVTNATITWTSATNSGTRGYDPATGGWFAGTTKPLAWFSYAAISASMPKPVLFWDMSIGANSWAYLFGDGGASGVRSPAYTYNAAGYFTVTQSVTGPAGTSSFSRPILIGLSNPIEDSRFFVRQQYLDFLAREPEPGGFNAWLSVLNNCPNPFNVDPNSSSAGCDRITVSSCFFRSQEFEIKGLYVYKFYRVAFQDPPSSLPAYSDISRDMRFVTGQTSSEVFAKKAAFAEAFVQGTRFGNLYNGLSNSAYVSALLYPYGLSAITTTDPANPDDSGQVVLTDSDLVTRLNNLTMTRAQVLRAIVQSQEVNAIEFNGAFVAMQYYGYLRRTPDAVGYDAWLSYLNANPTDFRTMVHGFVYSQEYALRFGPI